MSIERFLSLLGRMLIDVTISRLRANYTVRHKTETEREMVIARTVTANESSSLSVSNSAVARRRSVWVIRMLPVAALAFLTMLLVPNITNAREASASRSHATTFTQEKFDRAQKEGRLILVESYADWCAPCRIQAPIVKRLRKEKRYRGLVLLRVGEDTPRSVWKKLGLAGYGQFLVFRGKREVKRGSPLNEASMRALLSG